MLHGLRELHTSDFRGSHGFSFAGRSTVPLAARGYFPIMAA